jgi:hypothetical protein
MMQLKAFHGVRFRYNVTDTKEINKRGGA